MNQLMMVQTESSNNHRQINIYQTFNFQIHQVSIFIFHFVYVNLVSLNISLRAAPGQRQHTHMDNGCIYMH